MLNTKQKQILYIAIIILYTAKIIYRYIQKNEVDYFDVGLGLFWLVLLLLTTRKDKEVS